MLETLMFFLYRTVAFEQIILFMVLVAVGMKLVMLPIDIVAYQQNRKMRLMQPKMKEAQKIKDVKAQADAMAKLYTEAGINPGLFLMSTVLQFIIVIAFWGAIRNFSNMSGVNFHTFGIDLAKPSVLLVVPFLVIFLVQIRQQMQQTAQGLGKEQLIMFGVLMLISFGVLSTLQAAFVIYLLAFSLVSVTENAVFGRMFDSPPA